MEFKRSLALLVAIAITGCSLSTVDAMQEGRAFIAKGDIASAVIAFRNAVQADPTAIAARVALGDALERTGELTGAEQHYRHALELGGDKDYLVPKIAVILMDRSDLLTLIKDFGDKQLSSTIANSDLRGILSVTHLTLGEKSKALKELSSVAVETPAVRLARAQLALGEGNDQEASNELEKVLKDANPPWWVLRAASRVYWARGDGERALSTMKAAFDVAGAHPDVMGEYGEKLLRAGSVEEAKRMLEKLKDFAPKHYRTAVLETMLQVERGNLDAAYSSAIRVLASLPDHIPMQLLATKVELHRNELSSAEARLRRILEQNPRLVEALRMRYLLELRQGREKQAHETINQALKLAPKDRDLLAASGNMAWERGERVNAVRQFSDAAQMEPRQAQLLSRLAEMKYALGAKDEALLAIDEAISLSEKDTSSREVVLRASMRMHLLDKAKAMAEREIKLHPKDPEPLMWMAGVLGSQGNASGAFEQISLALDARADYYPALFALSKLAASKGHFEAYDKRLQAAIQGGGKDARIYLDQIRRLQLTGTSPEQLGAVFDLGLKADPASTELRERAVLHWLAHGNKDKALTLASEGEAAQPDNVSLIALAASTNQLMGNHETAVKKFGQLVASMPESIDWTLVYARSLVLAKRSNEALSVLGKLVTARPDEPVAYRTLAMLQLDERRKDDALLTARMLSERPKYRVHGLLLLGDLHARAKEKKEALAAYADATKAGAGDMATVRKIELLDQLGFKSAADTELRQWLSSSAKNIAALTLAARREYGQGNFAAASQHFEKVVGLQPRNAMALNDLAWAYAKDGNPAALVTAKKAIELDPQNPIILDTLAEAQVVVGQINEAIANLRKALQIGPDKASTRIRLAQLLTDSGETKEANALLRNLDDRKYDRNAAVRLKAER